MTREQRDHLRHRLRQERERVLGALARFGARDVETARRAAERSGAPSHALHEPDSYNKALDALELSRLSRELAEIDDALKRLDEAPGGFGIDERTGQSIPFAQLERTPWLRTLGSSEHATDLVAADPDVLQAYRNERYSG